MVHKIYKIHVNELFILSVRLILSVNSRLLAVNFVGSQSYMWIFECMVISVPNPHFVQGSTVYFYSWDGYIYAKVNQVKHLTFLYFNVYILYLNLKIESSWSLGSHNLAFWWIWSWSSFLWKMNSQTKL